MQRVLVVEDDNAIRLSLTELLSNEGYDVSSVSNGQEALDLLAKGELLPSIILLDLMMPLMDGFSFRKKQIADPRIKDMPVIIMSADGNVQEKLKEVGGKAYIRKPIDIDVLLKTIESFALKA
jgi:CheY-like chemotaxis protein